MTSLQKYTQQLSLWSLLLIPFIMPIYSKPLGVLIGIFSLLHLAHGIINRTFLIPKDNVFWLAVIFFILHLISVSYSANKDKAWFDIEVKLSLILFPVLFAFKNKLFHQKQHYIYIAFISGTLISGIWMLTDAYELAKSIGHKAYYYTNICKIHTSYISLYFIFSILLQIKLILSKKQTIYTHFLLALLIIFHLRMIFLFQSKGTMIAMATAWLFMLVFSIIKKKKKLIWISSLLIICSSFFYLTEKNNRMEAMVHTVQEIKEKGKSEDTTTGIRASIWKITLSKIKENPILGVGNGDVIPTLMEGYQKEKLQKAIDLKLNTHNQYLETFLSLGVLGFLNLIILLGYAFISALKDNNWLKTSFIIIIGISFLPESMLNLRSGTVFFGFFYFLLFQAFNNKHSKNKFTIE